MPSIPPPADATEIGLADMIESLRHELQLSLQKGKNQAVSFAVGKVELELKVAISHKAQGEGGVGFWILKAGASAEAARDTAHTFKLTLVPIDSASGAWLKVNSETGEAPGND